MRGHRAPLRGDVRGLFRQHLGHDRLRRGTGERRLSYHHLVEHGAQGVHVAACVQLPVAHGLLGTHVVRRPDRQSRLREPRAACLAHRKRDPEVRNQGLAVVQQHVLGLDVAVDHPVSVRVIQCRRHRLGDFEGVADGQLLLAMQPLSQRLALHQWHDIVKKRVRLARVVERQNVRVLQVGRDLDLLQEPLGPNHRGQFRPQDLQGHFAVVFYVVREVDRSHAAGADLFLDFVAVGEGGLEAV